MVASSVPFTPPRVGDARRVVFSSADLVGDLLVDRSSASALRRCPASPRPDVATAAPSTAKANVRRPCGPRRRAVEVPRSVSKGRRRSVGGRAPRTCSRAPSQRAGFSHAVECRAQQRHPASRPSSTRSRTPSTDWSSRPTAPRSGRSCRARRRSVPLAGSRLTCLGQHRWSEASRSAALPNRSSRRARAPDCSPVASGAVLSRASAATSALLRHESRPRTSASRSISTRPPIDPAGPYVIPSCSTARGRGRRQRGRCRPRRRRRIPRSGSRRQRRELRHAPSPRLRSVPTRSRRHAPFALRASRR